VVDIVDFSKYKRIAFGKQDHNVDVGIRLIVAAGFKAEQKLPHAGEFLA